MNTLYFYTIECIKNASNDIVGKVHKNTACMYRVSHKGRTIAKYVKSIFSIILPSFSSLSRSGLFFSFEKRASILGNPVCNICMCTYFSSSEYIL